MPAALPETKLFAVEMGKGACCDCGRQAETQFAIATGKGEAKRLAAEVKATRKVGGKCGDVVCGICVAKRIADKGLFVTEMMKYSPIKFEMVTFSLKCLDCGKDLPFGTWAFFHAESGSAICIECGAKRGWSDKALAVYNVKVAEAKLVLSALRKRTKVESAGLSLIEEKVELHQIGENYTELERQIVGAIQKLEAYFNAVATPEEKAALQQLEREIHNLQDLALEIKREIEVRLFWLDKNERKVKLTQAAMATDDEELEKMRQAEGAGAEVAAR